ncbi:MAG TPA: branched-chain amino acid ABC transporter permease [Acidimicrobiia bacterium]|nr:branched-chain amino acid ABC transporter permease [Acidimicrobiia bacterium]
MDIVDILIGAARASVGVQAAAFALAAIGLNVHYGYTGLLNFGHVGFMLLGAYGTAVTVHHGGSLWLGILVGILAAVAFGIILGLPTLRLRYDYLAIVTIAAAEILRLGARSPSAEPLTRGVFGIQQFADSFYDLNPLARGRYGWGDFAFSHRVLWVMLVGWGLVALATALVWLLTRSPWGRVLRAVREDEDAARSLGKNAFWFKLQSLVVGGVIGSLAGTLLAVDTQSVNPDTYQAVITFFAYTVLILGGPATRLGPVAGAIVFWFLLQFTALFLTEAIAVGWISESLLSRQEVSAVRFALVGLGLMLLVIFRPQGIFGRRQEMLVDA